VVLGALASISMVNPDTEPRHLAIPLLVPGFGYGLVVAFIGRVMGQPAMAALQARCGALGWHSGSPSLEPWWPHRFLPA
jgi:hypothetical protein